MEESKEVTLAKGIEEAVRSIGLVGERMLHSVEQALIEMQSFLAAAGIENLKEAAENLDKAVKAIPKELAERGWYLCPDLPGSTAVEAVVLMKESPEAGDTFMTKWINASLVRIEDQVLGRFPLREAILRDAFTAHRDGKYTLSIPVLLTQVDGIFWDLTGLSATLFSRERKKLAGMNQYVQTRCQKPGEDDDWLWVLLTEITPIKEKCTPGHQTRTSLNRNAILHGFDTQYPCETNSCKIISLLFFVATLPTATCDDREVE